jgi:hypothetical protein
MVWCSAKLKGLEGDIAHSCLSFQNHDFEEGKEDDKTLRAGKAKMLSSPLSLHSCPIKDMILRWSCAGNARLPARKSKTGAGVAWWSFKSLWM